MYDLSFAWTLNGYVQIYTLKWFNVLHIISRQFLFFFLDKFMIYLANVGRHIYLYHNSSCYEISNLLFDILKSIKMYKKFKCELPFKA